MQINGLSELERADFSAFEGKKLSWAHLAKGCVARISSQLLQLSSLREASENADLLHHRLESRRAQSVRTTNETANSILAVYHAARSLNELNQMANGTLPHDIDVTGRSVAVLSSDVDSWHSLPMHPTFVREQSIWNGSSNPRSRPY